MTENTAPVETVDAENTVEVETQAETTAEETLESAQQAQTTEANTQAEAAEEEGVKFTDLGLDARVLAALEEVGYEKPSPIQEQTIPLLLEGRDVLGMAQTGTGKTAAFALPALSRMAELSDIYGPSRDTQVLVLAPTRELALQVAEAFSSYATAMDDFTVLPVYGGSPYGPQLAGLRRGAQVVVGTPGRVIDHLERGSLDLSNLQYVVLDEADEMLRMGFAEEVEKILAQTPEDKQVALFSATMPKGIRAIADNYLKNPAEVRIKAKVATNANIRQRYMQVMHSHKLDAMTRVLEVEEYDGIIVFVRTKKETEEVADKLKARGFAAAAINGDIPQQLRERTVDALRDGRIDILVATDVAARGLDVERISLVVNFDIPHDTESYVHRIGRTGRAGRDGEAILFVTPREKYMLRQIEKATRQKVEPMHMPTAQDVNENRKARFAQQITDTIESEDLSFFRSIIEAYENEHDTTPEDIAAALAIIAQQGRSFFLDESDDIAHKSKPFAEGDDRPRKGERGAKRSYNDENMVNYKLNVGRSSRVTAGAIVGALANEGGIKGSDVGSIDIRQHFTIVGLPKDLPRDFFDRLRDTKVAGEFINIRKDNGPKGGGRGGFRGDRDGGFKRDRDFGGRGGRDRDFGGRSERGERGGRDGGFKRDRDFGGRGGRDRDFGSRSERGGRDGFKRDRDFGSRSERGGRSGFKKKNY
ncbi:MAG: DEAD/DEAH box helicase [Rothia sp. (in: high G+C Gram-positive bacteria)]|uniref:DEAD/DEAH box helicase n=1 Tax=Rothia sp. (in: high G+C Gram-positive bacteria) TaxID=1885016 RepID=UPI0026DED680|nr:DEAD/DEAH box helicase [Rothia sp. (in: high G+C Gram-positive bacteria)]MDO5751121.1 DEAD/DEAH box helicase [Rothia sp. (in: high G+C Gram-positive bacteria)]